MERAERKQPTHFVAIQIKNEVIHSQVKETQLKFVGGSNKILERALISPKRLHLTMFVMLLKDETDLQQAKLALDVAASEIMKDLTQPLILHVAGINNFGKNVLYALPNNDKLSTIGEIVNKSFCDKGLFSTDRRSSNTHHITLMKLSQDPTLYKKGVKKIDSSVWEQYKDSDFGLERVTSLQLCAMKNAADDSGYYEICHVSSLMQDTETG